MALEYSIGEFQFLSLDGVPPCRKDELAVIVRPGVDGLAFLITGKRGQPFTLRSRVDCESRDNAMAKRAEYAALVGAGKQTLVWGNYALASEDDAKVMVLDVRPIMAGELLVSSGGLNAPSLGYLECDWDLILC